MAIAEAFAMELQQEAAATRRILERVPAEHFAWQPHEKSMSMIRLASHIVETPGWLKSIVEADELSFNMAEYVPYEAESVAALVAKFDENVAEALAELGGKDDAYMMALWRMKIDGNLVFELPRVAVARGFGLNHLYHHRGQLTVLFRLKDVPVPAIYGPSADEEPPG